MVTGNSELKWCFARQTFELHEKDATDVRWCMVSVHRHKEEPQIFILKEPFLKIFLKTCPADRTNTLSY